MALMVIDFGIQQKLAAIILELYDVLSKQEFGCRAQEISSPDARGALMDRAQLLMRDWHELHEFDEDAHANPVLVKALLIMYSDTVASYHEATAQAGNSGVSSDPYQLPERR
jgi:hypothetical protein